MFNRVKKGVGAFALGMMLAAAPAWAVDNTFPTSGDTKMCSGRPWIDVTCNGADPTGAADSAAAISTTVTQAIAGGYPVHFPAGTYKINSLVTIDTTGFGVGGFRIISENATIDATAVTGLALSIKRSGGTTGSPAVDQNFTIQGALTVNGNASSYVVQIGQTDFSDKFQGARIDHLVVTNASANAAAGGARINFVGPDADLWISGTTAGGAASVSGLAVDQLQSSRLAGAGSTAGASGAALLFQNGASINNTVFGFGYSAGSNTCLSIPSTTATKNVFIAPYFGCTTAINAPQNFGGNILIAPTYAGTNQGPLSSGVGTIERGALGRYASPAVASYTAAGVDGGLVLSAANATGGASLPVTLPDATAVGTGWTMGFVSGGGKAIVLSTQGADRILGPGNAQLTTLTLGPGNFEFIQVQSNSGNYVITSLTPASALANGLASASPAAWTFPDDTGYAATQGDNAHTLSSALAGGTMTVTLPSTTDIAAGWSLGLYVDGNGIVVNVNGVSGGAIKRASGASVSTYTVLNAIGSRVVLSFDGANFREVTVPALGFTPVNPAAAEFTETIHLRSTTLIDGNGIFWHSPRGSWITAVDSAANPTGSDLVLAYKCGGVDAICLPGVDQIYNNHNQQGVSDYAIVNPGAGYVTGDRVTFNSGCPSNPIGVVTATAGAVTAVTPYIQGGYGRCLVDPTGTQSALSTSGVGAGLTVTMTSMMNMPTLSIGGAGVTGAVTPLFNLYEVVIQPYTSMPLMGGLAIRQSVSNTGWAFSIDTPSGSDYDIFHISNIGDMATNGYIHLRTPSFGGHTAPDLPALGAGFISVNNTEGLVLSGHGTTYEMVFRDRNNANILSVAAASLQVDFAASVLTHGVLRLQSTISAFALSTGQAQLLSSAAIGAMFQGFGDSIDVALVNKDSGVALYVPTGTINVAGNGTIQAIGGFIAAGVVGVACSGAPTASFAAVGGIVTAC